MKRTYTRGATEEFLRYLAEHGLRSRPQLVESGWWDRIHSRLDDLVSAGVLRQVEIANPDSGRLYARLVVRAWEIGDVPYVRETQRSNLTPEAARKGHEKLSALALQRRIDAAISLLEGAGYLVTPPSEKP